MAVGHAKTEGIELTLNMSYDEARDLLQFTAKNSKYFSNTLRKDFEFAGEENIGRVMQTLAAIYLALDDAGVRL